MRGLRLVLLMCALAAGVAAATASGAAALNVAPFLDCVSYDAPDNVVTAIFGYYSLGTDDPIEVDVGPDNFFTPSPPDQGQTTLFFPGANHDAFEVSFARSVTSEVTWHLNGFAVAANVDSAACSHGATNFGGTAVYGTPRVGSTLFAGVGAWFGRISSFDITWQRQDGDAWTTVGTGFTYVPAAADAGHALRTQVTAHDVDGPSVFQSLPVTVAAAIAPGEPAVSGSSVVGSTLTASPGTWTGASSFAYDWQRCAETCASTGVTTQTYDVGAADLGDTLRVAVTPQGETAPTPISAETATVHAPTPLATSTASLSFGPVTVGRGSNGKLTVTVTNTTGSPQILGGWSRTGPAAGDFPIASKCASNPPLAAHATCGIVVRFKPTATGPRTATLQVYDGAGGGPAAVALSGTGTP